MMTFRPCQTGVLAALIALSLAAPAFAQSQTTINGGPKLGQLKTTFFGEYGYGKGEAGGTEFTVKSPMFGLEHRHSSRIAFSADWGFFTTEVDAGGGADFSETDFGNPFLAGHITLNPPTLKLDIGAGVALPTARLSDDPAEAALESARYSTANGLRGMWNQWLFAPDMLTIAAPARLEISVPGLMLAGEGAIAYMASTGDNSDNEFLVQLAAEGALGFGLAQLGLRANFVDLPTEDESHQLSIEPFFRAPLSVLSFTVASSSTSMIPRVAPSPTTGCGASWLASASTCSRDPASGPAPVATRAAARAV